MSENIEHKGLKIRIEQDQDAESSRENQDNFGTMVCFHSQYNLGDVQGRKSYGSGEDFIRALASDHADDIQDKTLEECQSIIDDHFVMLPLFLYDHSGITMSCHPFSCRWDSGQVGWIYVSNKDAMENWPRKSMGAKVSYKDGKPAKTVRQRAIDLLEAEVKEYDQFLTGDVWGYIVEDGEPDQDSCCGFYGYDYCVEQAKEAANHIVERRRKSKLEKAKAFIKHAVPLQNRVYA